MDTSGYTRLSLVRTWLSVPTSGSGRAEAWLVRFGTMAWMDKEEPSWGNKRCNTTVSISVLPSERYGITQFALCFLPCIYTTGFGCADRPSS